MQTPSRPYSLPMVVGFLSLLAILGLIYLLGRISAEILAACVTAIASVVAIALTKHYENRTRIDQEIHAKKVPIYEELMGTLFSVVFASKKGKPSPTEGELVRFFAEITPKLVVWASKDVILAWNKIRTGGQKEAPAMLRQWEELLVAIRKDLGHDRESLPPGTLLRMFVNDLPENPS